MLRNFLNLKVTKFPCGGFTIGTALLHAVCDGFGVARFIHSLTELARGKHEPSVLPVWERERLARKIDNEPARVPGGAGARASLLATSPFMPSSDLVCFNIFSFFRLYRIRIICSYEKVKKINNTQKGLS